MLKTVKYSLAILILLIGGLLLLPLFIDVNDYKPEIIEQVEDATGRTLEIANIEASLFPWVGIRLEGVRLFNREGFSEHDFLKLDAVDIQLAMIPLLSKEIEVKRFLLLAPELHLERNAKGETNWADLLGSPDGIAVETVVETSGGSNIEPESSPKSLSKDQPQSNVGSLAVFNADLLQLKDGKLFWSDALQQKNVELQGIQVELSDVQLNRAMNLKASLMIGSEPLKLDGRIGPVSDLKPLDVNRLPIQLHVHGEQLALANFSSWLSDLPELLGTAQTAHVGLDVQLEQRPDGFRVSNGYMQWDDKHIVRADWKLEMPKDKRVDIRHLGLAVDDKKILSMQGDVTLGHRLHYQLRMKAEPLSRVWLSSLLPDVAVAYAEHPKPWNHVSFGALIAGGVDRVEVRDLKLLLDADLVQVSGVVGFANAPNIRLRVVSKSLHLDPWLPHTVENRVQESVEVVNNAKPEVSKQVGDDKLVNQSNEPDLRFLKPWLVNAQVQIDQLHAQSMQLEHVRVKLKGKNGIFTLDPLRFEIAGGQVSEELRLNVAVYPARWTESISASGVNIAPILKSQLDNDMVAGVLKANTKLSATGLLPETFLPNLHGRGYLTLHDGSIKGFDIAAILRNLGSPKLNAQSQETAFTQMSGSFTIQQGQVKNDDLYMASPFFRLTGSGKVDLPAKELDYHVKPKLIGTLIGQGDTVTVRKGLSVPLHITGSFDALKVQPEIDTKAAVKSIAGSLLRGEKITGKTVLKGLFQSGEESPQPQQAPAAPKNNTPSLEKEVNKALGKLLGL